jgi:hypothetical protein
VNSKQRRGKDRPFDGRSFIRRPPEYKLNYRRSYYSAGWDRKKERGKQERKWIPQTGIRRSPGRVARRNPK